jgi:precorrin-6B methylase 2
VLNLVSPSAGEVFWDLGCGLAKPMVAAALTYPYLKAIKGVEYLDGLYDIAKQI